MSLLSDRIQKIDASGIRRVWQMAINMTDPVNFSIGEPDFDAPESVKQAAVKAINDGQNGYTLTTGYEPLRAAIAQQVTEEVQWKKPQVMVTCGVSGGLNISLTALINPGDEVLIPDPYFVMYNQLIDMLGGSCKFIDTYPDFKLDADKIEAQITEKSKLLLINSPSNPSGTVYSPEELKAVARVAQKHNLLVISDEIYTDFSYDTPAESIARYYENTIILGGYSKAYGIPGWRLGYLAVPESLSELFNAMVNFQQYSFVCAPHPLQVAAVTALGCDMTEQIDNYRNKRDLIFNGLKDRFGLVKPAGAFYAFVPAPGGNATAFVTKAIETNVLVIPGNIFSQRDTHFRISYATSDAMIAKGVERLNRLADSF
ncbi:MAG: aminotransferase class I/II-fold pyridoxal phosphate-dependent enzyme [Phycisphaerae bacterium]|nr:aminotransferase class I/II-fold pyridoxal phosphate-dependent enzyme [Phycisphaerae bacterium]